MGKFLELISDNTNATLKKRADSLNTAAEIAQKNIINSLKQQRSELELKIADLTDFAPESSESLRPGNKNWNAKNWAEELQKTKEQIWQLDVSLKIANETYKEFFE